MPNVQISPLFLDKDIFQVFRYNGDSGLVILFK